MLRVVRAVVVVKEEMLAVAVAVLVTRHQLLHRKEIMVLVVETILLAVAVVALVLVAVGQAQEQAHLIHLLVLPLLMPQEVVEETIVAVAVLVQPTLETAQTTLEVRQAPPKVAVLVLWLCVTQTLLMMPHLQQVHQHSQIREAIKSILLLAQER